MEELLVEDMLVKFNKENIMKVGDKRLLQFNRRSKGKILWLK